MPGIAGIVSHEPPDVCRRHLLTMIDSMRHDPEYVHGTREAPELGVYVGWIAHPGSFAATESGTAADGTRDLVLAGECYDAGSRRVTVAPQERRPGTSAGVLLEACDRLGESWVAQLNGQFSAVLIDRTRESACLFNDRYGVERLYVRETSGTTVFASEAKALLRLPGPRSFDDDGVAQFLAFGCPLGGRTLFRGIRTLDGGSLWTFSRDGCRKRRYFTPSQWEQQQGLSSDEFQSRFESQFQKALPRYLSGQGRIGISLTGGLDSRMIMARLPDLSPSPICYTFAGLDGMTLDARIGARVAAACGLEHHVLRIGQDFLADYRRHLDRTVYVTDGAAGAIWTHEIYLSEQARQLAPIRLTGNFGSEILRSMSTLKRLDLSRDLISPEFRGHVAAVADGAGAAGASSLSFAAFSEIPWKLFGILASGKSRLTVRTPYLDNDLVALAYRAPAGVRTSSASALQLVQHGNPRLAAIPTDRHAVSDGAGFVYAMKRLLAEVSFKVDYMHKEAPPRGMASVLDRLAAFDRFGVFGAHKWLPYRLWFRDDIGHVLREVADDPATVRLGYFQHQALDRLTDDHVRGRKNCVPELNAVLTLSAVDRLLLRAAN